MRAELAEHGFSALFVSVSGEVARSIVGHVMGPIVGTFLKLIDPTRKKLDLLIAEPLQTGVRSAQLALAIRLDSRIDTNIREQHLASALQSLEKAFSYARGSGKSDECIKIRLAQASIAKCMGGDGAVRVYLEEHRADLEHKFRSCHEDLKRSAAELARYQAKMGSSDQDTADSLYQEYIKGRRKPLKIREPHPESPLLGWIEGESPSKFLRKKLGRLEKDGVRAKENARIRVFLNLRVNQVASQQRLNDLLSFQRFWATPLPT